MPIDPSRADDVASALLAYLSTFLTRDIAFAEPPEAIGRGFDTHIYAFRLTGEALAASWVQPVVLRLYTTPAQADKAEREAAIQRFAATHGYPALDPLAVERQATAFELPLMIMERVEGVPMLEAIGISPFAVRRQFAAMANAHVALHRLPLDGCPLPSNGPLIERELEQMRERVPRLSTRELDRPLDWLEAHRGTVIAEEPSLCHGDFHPLNIMVDGSDHLTVLDWSDAAVGDRHYDIGRTTALFTFAWIAAESMAERMVLRLARGLLSRSYLTPYRKQLPVDGERLRYWQAFHAGWGWMQLLEIEEPGNPNMAGAREDSAARLPKGLLRHLRAYFYERAGLRQAKW